jgi:predicted NBD/HSP70 family sugar kinase
LRLPAWGDGARQPTALAQAPELAATVTQEQWLALNRAAAAGDEGARAQVRAWARQQARAAAAEVAHPDPCPGRRGFEGWMWAREPAPEKRRRDRTTPEYRAYQREWARAKRAEAGATPRLKRRTYA